MAPRYIYSAIAAVLCIAAIITRAQGTSVLISIVALGCGALFLVLAMRHNNGSQPGKHRPLQDSDLTEENKAELRRLLGEGQFGTAVNQVRLWFKHVGEQEASDFVRSLSQSR